MPDKLPPLPKGYSFVDKPSSEPALPEGFSFAPRLPLRNDRPSPYRGMLEGAGTLMRDVGEIVIEDTPRAIGGLASLLGSGADRIYQAYTGPDKVKYLAAGPFGAPMAIAEGIGEKIAEDPMRAVYMTGRTAASTAAALPTLGIGAEAGGQAFDAAIRATAPGFLPDKSLDDIIKETRKGTLAGALGYLGAAGLARGADIVRNVSKDKAILNYMNKTGPEAVGIQHGFPRGITRKEMVLAGDLKDAQKVIAKFGLVDDLKIDPTDPLSGVENFGKYQLRIKDTLRKIDADRNALIGETDTLLGPGVNKGVSVADIDLSKIRKLAEKRQKLFATEPEANALLKTAKGVEDDFIIKRLRKPMNARDMMDYLQDIYHEQKQAKRFDALLRSKEGVDPSALAKSEAHAAGLDFLAKEIRGKLIKHIDDAYETAGLAPRGDELDQLLRDYSNLKPLEDAADRVAGAWAAKRASLAAGSLTSPISGASINAAGSPRFYFGQAALKPALGYLGRGPLREVLNAPSDLISALQDINRYAANPRMRLIDFNSPAIPKTVNIVAQPTLSTLLTEEGLKKNSKMSVDKYSFLDPLTKAQVKHESNFDTHAVSDAGAQGLLQLMPATGREWHKRLGIKEKYNPFNSEQNLKIGIAYRKHLENKYNGDVRLALAAYNWGMGNIDKAVRKHGASWDAIRAYVPVETRNYVARILRDASIA